ncbi:hypothetical protein ACR9PT_11155 [Piscirickettsia salmonis]|uniref:hypothetical protein n=1 Tax=Piscirickettsia salmonis TaxID=1238 RepID=UPI003EB8FB4D
MKAAIKKWFKVGASFNFDTYHNYVMAGVVPGLLLGAVIAIDLFELPVWGWSKLLTPGDYIKIVSALSTIYIAYLAYRINKRQAIHNKTRDRNEAIKDIRNCINSVYYKEAKRDGRISKKALDSIHTNLEAHHYRSIYNNLTIDEFINSHKQVINLIPLSINQGLKVWKSFCDCLNSSQTGEMPEKRRIMFAWDKLADEMLNSSLEYISQNSSSSSPYIASRQLTTFFDDYIKAYQELSNLKKVKNLSQEEVTEMFQEISRYSMNNALSQKEYFEELHKCFSKIQYKENT